MILSFLKKNISLPPAILIIDIGATSVAGAIVRIEPNKKPDILFTVRKEIQTQHTITAASFLFAMNNALTLVLKIIHARRAAQPSHIFCTLSSPWFIIKDRDVQKTMPEVFKITPQSLEECIDEDIEKLKDEEKKKLPYDDIQIIEKKIIRVHLDHCESTNPYGIMASHIALKAMITISSKLVIKRISQTLGVFFHTPEVHFSAFPIAGFSIVRDMFPTEKNFLFLDITGEATDVSLIGGDMLLKINSFPIGKNFFIRALSTELSTSYEEATTLFRMFFSDTLHNSKRIMIEKIIQDTREKWCTQFKKIWSTFSKEGIVPHRIFFMSDPDIAIYFITLIDSIKEQIFTSRMGPVKYLDQKTLEKYVSIESSPFGDPFIITEVFFVMKILEQKGKRETKNYKI